MNCISCGVSMFEKPLSRTNPTGQPNAGWMCQDCIKKKEPELFKNLSASGDFKITNDIFGAINNTSSGRCPNCGASEIDAMTPITTYACGSSDYDQRPGTFKKSPSCTTTPPQNKS